MPPDTVTPVRPRAAKGTTQAMRAAGSGIPAFPRRPNTLLSSAKQAQSIISVPIYSQNACCLAMRTRTIAAIIVVVVIVIAVAGAAFVLTLQAPQVQGVSVRSIDNVSRSGFTLTFVINLYNPNVVGVSIKSLTYNLVLTSSNQVLSTGSATGIQVPARGASRSPYSLPFTSGLHSALWCKLSWQKA